MAGGRPRKVSFSPDEMIELGKEMIEWVRHNDPLHLSQWYTIHKGFIYKEWKTFIQRPEFVPYYEVALKMVGMKYLDGESKKIKQGISERWQRVYFRDLCEKEDDDFQAKIDRDLEAKKKLLMMQHELDNIDIKKVTPELSAQFDAIMKMLGKSQSSALNIESTNINEEHKS